MAKLLTDSGANLNYFHNNSDLVLSYVGSVEVAEEILNSGGDPNAQDSDGKTPLHYAAMRKNAEYFKFLLDNGATIGIHDKAGKTPMDYVRDNNDKEILRIVEEHASLTRDKELWPQQLIFCKAWYT